MLTSRLQSISDGTLKLRIFRDSSPVAVSEVISLWQVDSDFRSLFTRALAEAPFQSFRWENPAITGASISQPFESVIVNSRGLPSAPDVNSFAEHFRTANDETIVTFSNLGNDAVLVVPCPKTRPSAYIHLAAFLREADESQHQDLWKAVGRAMAQRVNNVPVWLNTAGAGVAWLHVRLDDRPKYYVHTPYRLDQ